MEGAYIEESYIKGTAPTNTIDFIRTIISFTNVVAFVPWSPNRNTYGEVCTYIVLGKTSLTDAAWSSPTNSAYRFFKVKMETP